MVNIAAMLRIPPRAVDSGDESQGADETRLDLVFAALSDPIRRRILERLDGQALLVSELAEPFEISLQGVSRHIQVLVRAGLVQQERSGRISRCSLDVGPLLDAAVWLNRYTKYWQQQFDVLASTLAEIDERRAAETARAAVSVRPAQAARPAESGRSAQPARARKRARSARRK